MALSSVFILPVAVYCTIFAALEGEVCSAPAVCGLDE